MRATSLFILMLTTTMAGFAAGRFWTMPPPHPPPTTHLGLTIEKIQPLSSLVTARVDVADVVETTLAGYTGSVKVAILVKGDFLLGTDLSAGRFEAVDHDRHTATLRLPQPAAASPRVDHSRTRVFSVNTNGLWQIVPSDEGRAAVVNRAYADAQRIIAEAAVEPAGIDRARRQAESVLRAFFEAMGWIVEIRWMD